MHQLSAEMKFCGELCDECREVCLATVAHCLDKGGRHAEFAHIRVLLDCADICTASAGFLMRGSDLHGGVCALCAEVCERCARSCESFADEADMKRCVETCRRCADSCRQMASGRR
jgi:hypothetical protein